MNLLLFRFINTEKKQAETITVFFNFIHKLPNILLAVLTEYIELLLGVIIVDVDVSNTEWLFCLRDLKDK